MQIKHLKEFYNVDTISQDKGWKRVHEAIGELTEDLCIDFTDINIIEPWQCTEFKHLIKEPHLYMKFVNNEEVVNRIKMMCIIDGLDENRIENITIELPKEKTAEEKKAEKYGMQLIPYFDISTDGVATLELEKRYDQIQSTNTMSYIDYAIKELHKTQDINEFILKFGDLKTLPNVLQVVADMMVEYEGMGMHLLIDSNDKEVLDSMGLFIYNSTNKDYSTEERKAMIHDNLKDMTPGILVKYKKSKAVDEFGREGKGEIVSSRIALFKGIVHDTKSGEVCASIQTFNNNYFYTKQHWAVEHDNEEPTSLHSEELLIPLSQLGIGNVFLGSKYHFLLPIQQDASESKTVIIDIDEDEHNIKQVCTIPERIEHVFDSWGIQFNREELHKSIDATKRLLESTAVKENSNFEGIKLHNGNKTMSNAI